MRFPQEINPLLYFVMMCLVYFYSLLRFPSSLSTLTYCFCIAVDDFRSISQQLLSSHFTQHVENNRIGRVEYLPIQWHMALHGDATGIDRLVH